MTRISCSLSKCVARLDCCFSLWVELPDLPSAVSTLPSSRPFCQVASSQKAATTYNVNLYVCKSLVPGMNVNLLDYEGENGSDTPVMAAVSSRNTMILFGDNRLPPLPTRQPPDAFSNPAPASPFWAF